MEREDMEPVRPQIQKERMERFRDILLLRKLYCTVVEAEQDVIGATHRVRVVPSMVALVVLRRIYKDILEKVQAAEEAVAQLTIILIWEQVEMVTAV